MPTLCIFPSPLTSLSSSKAPTALGARTLLGAIPQLLHSSYIARIQNPTLAGSPSWPVPEDSEMFYDLTNFLKSSNQVVMRGLYFRDFTQFCLKGMVSSGFLFLLFVSFFLSFIRPYMVVYKLFNSCMKGMNGFLFILLFSCLSCPSDVLTIPNFARQIPPELASHPASKCGTQVLPTHQDLKRQIK